jgi:hypothetical protein
MRQSGKTVSGDEMEVCSKRCDLKSMDEVQKKPMFMRVCDEANRHLGLLLLMSKNIKYEMKKTLGMIELKK